MNKVILIGRLTKDPELRYTPGGGKAVTTFTLAVNGYNGATDFIPVVVWGRPAENVAKYVTKGRQIAVSGRISVRSYDAKDGTKRYVTEVVADAFDGVEFLAKNGEASGNNLRGLQTGGCIIDEYDYTEPIDDGNMPF